MMDNLYRDKSLISDIQYFRARMRMSKRVFAEGGVLKDVISIALNAPLVYGHVEDTERKFNEEDIASALLAASLIKMDSMFCQIDYHRDVFLIHHATPEVARTYFLYGHADDRSIGGEGIEKTCFDWKLLCFIGLDGRTDRPDRRMILQIFYFALTLLSMVSPDKDQVITIPSGHTNIRGKRVGVENLLSVLVDTKPDDIQFRCRVARSNWRNIMSGRGLFTKEAITLENGETRPGYIARCEFAGCEATAEITANNSKGSLPQVVISRKLTQQGWRINGKCLCPDHAKPQPKEPPVLKETVPLHRDMTPADRRRVFREIDDCWDEPKGRYIGNSTDNTISGKLGVPRIWVQQIREEAFGKTQRNGELEAIAETSKRLQGQCEKASAEALELASTFERLQLEVTTLRARIEAYE